MARPKSDIEPRILAAARDRFLAEGVDGASLRSIAEDAGTSIGMVYYYFPTKDDLFLAVVEEIYERMLGDLASTLAPDAPVRERLERMYVRFGQASDDELAILRLIAREALTSSARREQLLQRFMRGHVPMIARTIVDGFADGTFDPTRHPLVVVMATLALAGPPQAMRRILGDRSPFPGAPEGETLSHALVDVLLNGVGAKRP